MKTEQFMKQRFVELSEKSYYSERPIYSGFLGLHEQSLFFSMKNEFVSVNAFLDGGYPEAERQIAVFVPKTFHDTLNLPISVLKLTPAHPKFADKLGHRDFLGSLLNLGIERNLIGDIMVTDENQAYVIAADRMCEFIMENLSKVRHTLMRTEQMTDFTLSYTSKFKMIRNTVSSVRLDKIIALTFGLARSRVIKYIETGSVFVGGKNILSNGYAVKDNDIISVRGLGRCIFAGCESMTRKGRLTVTIKKYI